jgi:hypothetical protein
MDGFTAFLKRAKTTQPNTPICGVLFLLLW